MVSIDTYAEYLVNSKLREVIITNKQKISGYVVFKNFETYLINDVHTLDGMGNLTNWLKKNAITEQYSEEDFNLTAIARDILNVCYKKGFKPQKLAYSQILINQGLQLLQEYLHFSKHD